MKRTTAVIVTMMLLVCTPVALPATSATPEPGSFGTSGTISYPVDSISYPVSDLVFGSASESGDFKEEGPKITLAGEVLFAPNEDTLSGTSGTELKRLIDEIQNRKARAIKVVGHTDNVQDKAHNQRLSDRRAATVGRALDKALGGKVRVSTAGKGQNQPIADNETDTGRKMNRRVEVTVVK